MRTMRQLIIGGTVGLLWLINLSFDQQSSRLSPGLLGLHRPPPTWNLETSLWREAWGRAQQFRWQAKQAVRQALEAEEARAPGELDGAATESARRQLMAGDRLGSLRRARTAALQAAVLARSPAEAYRTAEFLILIFADTGQPAFEFAAARQLVALKPHSARAWQIWARVAQSTRGMTGRRAGTTPPLSPGGSEIDPAWPCLGLPGSRSSPGQEGASRVAAGWRSFLRIVTADGAAYRGPPGLDWNGLPACRRLNDGRWGNSPAAASHCF